MERSGPGVIVDAMIRGRTASTIHFEPASKLLSQRIPDLAVLAYGTNEASSKPDPRALPGSTRNDAGKDARVNAQDPVYSSAPVTER